MKFADITGHQQTIKALRDIVDSNKIPHAILLSGTPGIGKFNIARALAQYIHCKDKNGGDSCGKCPSCLQHSKLINPDTHFIYPIVKREKEGITVSKDLAEEWRQMLNEFPLMPPESWNNIIKAGNSQPSIYVNESEALIINASLSSFQEKYKIYIVWLPEKLRPEAANKILKIIEEPHEDTIFILVSNDPASILPTIYSRVQRFSLSPLSESDIADYLKTGHRLEQTMAEEISRLSEGSLAKAEEYALRPTELDEFSSLFIDIMRSAYALQGKNLKDLSEKVASMGREKIVRFLKYAARLVRENFIFNISQPSLNLMTPVEKNFSLKFSPYINEQNVEGLLLDISQAITDIERNANSKIVMFDLFFLISKWIRTKKPV